MEPADAIIQKVPPASYWKAENYKRSAACTLLLTHLAMIVTQCLYSGGNLFVKVTFSGHHVSQYVFAIYRDIIALIFLAPAALIVDRGARPAITRQSFAYMVLGGFLNIFAGQIFFLKGLSLASSSAVASIVVCSPLMSYVIAITFRFEIMQWRRRDGQFKALGMLLGIIGAFVTTFVKTAAALGSSVEISSAVGHSSSNVQPKVLGMEPHQLGILFVFMGCTCYCINGNLQVPGLKLYPPVSFTSCTYVIGTLFLVSYGLLSNNISKSDWIITKPLDILCIIYQGCLVSALCTALCAWTTLNGGPILVASYLPLQTVVTIVFAHVLLHETIFINQIVGGLLVGIGLYSLAHGKRETIRLDSSLENEKRTQSVDKLREPLLNQKDMP